tara:strand:+ start:1274 stop:1504 length:231 start_codon:yes stop_codon:yes gene_type:complete
MGYGSQAPAGTKTGKSPMKDKKPKKPLKPLTESQKSQLEKHKIHHTTKHMNKMRLLMREGKSFKQSHAIALKMVGK